MTIKEISIAIITMAFVYISVAPEPPPEPELPQAETQAAAPEPIFAPPPIAMPLPESTHPAYSWIIPPMYDRIQLEGNGIVTVRYDGLWGIVDLAAGQIVAPPIFDGIRTLSAFPDFIIASLPDSGESLINAAGELIAPFEYGWSTLFPEYDVAIVHERWVANSSARYNGIIELSTGREIVPFGRYHSIASFSVENGIAIARRWDASPSRLSGLIDITTGDEIAPLIYRDIGRLSDGLAAVWLDGSWGFINIRGEIAIPIIYDSICWLGFRDGMAVVERDGLWGIIDTTGAYIVPPTYDMITRAYDWAVLPDVDAAIIRTIDPASGNAYYGVIYMRTGEYIVHPIYDGHGRLAGEGLAIMSRGYDRSERSHYLVCLVTGHEIAPFPYDNIWPEGPYEPSGEEVQYNPGIFSQYDPGPIYFRNDTAIVWKFLPSHRRAYGVIDATGREILPPIYGGIERFSDGLFLTISGTHRYGIKDSAGQEVLPPVFSWIDAEWNRDCDDLAVINIGAEWPGYATNMPSGGLWGFVDNAGQIVVPPELDFAHVLAAGQNTAAVQTHDGLWGFIRIHASTHDHIYMYEYEIPNIHHAIQIRPSDEFFGLKLDEIYSSVLVYDDDGEFLHTKIARASFVGELTVSGFVWLGDMEMSTVIAIGWGYTPWFANEYHWWYSGWGCGRVPLHITNPEIFDDLDMDMQRDLLVEIIIRNPVLSYHFAHPFGEDWTYYPLVAEIVEILKIDYRH